MIQLWRNGRCEYVSSDIEDVMRRHNTLKAAGIATEVWIGHDEYMDENHMDVVFHVRERQLI